MTAPQPKPEPVMPIDWFRRCPGGGTVFVRPTTPQPSTEDTVPDEQILAVAAKTARDRGDIERAERFETAARDHERWPCAARQHGRTCTAVKNARKFLANCGIEVDGDAPAFIEQPMPTPNGHPSIQSLVRADLEAREQVGIQRYGTALQPHNGRDALRDLYEELLDGACYVKQKMVEESIARARVVSEVCDQIAETLRQHLLPPVTGREANEQEALYTALVKVFGDALLAATEASDSAPNLAALAEKPRLYNRVERDAPRVPSPIEVEPFPKVGQRVHGTDLDGRSVTGKLNGFFAWSNDAQKNVRANVELDDGFVTTVHTDSLRASR
ncbi:hypothetical protein Lesp02_70500 [Lentzea sp. NBRC 105346]|uniref:hypothetical protein n=1 Tax=Lentzea sp. NBRC 105346 TaxID=3032205 RepID=UPI0024A37A00|nr:hypothetical protein [Lentzea sp. NBRC 105346]GLZ34863.1 hypothetical protein Lesp02_70500 [Lentzea sp. NBRC 105346]